MKSVIKIGNMRTMEDVGKIRKAISDNQGIVACQISKESREISIVYDNYIIRLEDIVGSLEDLGYTII